MKGVIADFITTVLVRTISDKIIGYKNRYELGDLEDDDLVTKYLLVNAAPTTPPTPIPIIAGTTPTPLVTPYSLTSLPLYGLLRSSDNSFDWNTNVIYDGANFTINGNDDGSGKFADSFTFFIKP